LWKSHYPARAAAWHFARHAPLITELGIGELTYRAKTASEPVHLAIISGFAEVLGDRVTVLAETANGRKRSTWRVRRKPRSAPKSGWPPRQMIQMWIGARGRRAATLTDPHSGGTQAARRARLELTPNNGTSHDVHHALVPGLPTRKNIS